MYKDKFSKLVFKWIEDKYTLIYVETMLGGLWHLVDANKVDDNPRYIYGLDKLGEMIEPIFGEKGVEIANYWFETVVDGVESLLIDKFKELGYDYDKIFDDPDTDSKDIHQIKKVIFMDTLYYELLSENKIDKITIDFIHEKRQEV